MALCLLAGPVLAAEDPSLDGITSTITAAVDDANGLIASTEAGWPQWRGLHRDGISDERGLLGSWPEGGPRLLWDVDGLGKGWSSPIVVQERLYITGDVGDDLLVFALDHSGSIEWRVMNGRAWKGRYPGSRACCAFSEGRLYHMNAHGRLACLDAATGSELWAVDVLERFNARNIPWALSECLLLDGPNVIVTPGGRKALMAALDKRNGETVWTTDALDDIASYSSPILFRYMGRRVIANCSSGHGFGINADTGKLLWTVPLRSPLGVNAATPIYDAGSVFYVTPYSELGRLYHLRADQQGIAAEHLWTSPIDPVTGGAVLVNQTLYAAGYKKSRWWFAIDWKTGKTKYELKDFTTGAAIYADGRLYCLDERGSVALLKPTESNFEIMGRLRLFDKQVCDAWAHPVLLNGRLFLRYHGRLWCYDVKKP